MAKSKPPKVILDTNVLISALVFGGNPEEVYNLVLSKQVIAFISPVLLVELTETLAKKFRFDFIRINQLERLIKIHFKIVHSRKTINAVKDDDDNRVLEAAVEGQCGFIVTGDKHLLDLKSYKGIKIVTARQFLELIN